MPVHVTTTTTQSLSNKTFVGPTRFNSDVTIFGNLSCSGTQTFNNTVFSTTSAVSVVHVGSGPALWVGNNGTGDIASFYDIDQNVEVLHVGGNNGTFPNVGVKTSTPNVDFTVNGAISASSIIYSASGNSGQWNSAYSTVQTYSATTWNPAGRYLPLSGGTITGILSATNAIYTSGGVMNGSLNVATGQILSGGINISSLWGGGGGSSVVNTYTTNGIWINPSPSIARPVLITLVGGGGGGGSGRSSTDNTVVKGGGAGGAGGATVIFNTWTNLLSTSETITVGAGGTGGAGVPRTSNGNNGVGGGNTIMTLSGVALRAVGGNPGTNGTTAASNGGGNVANSTVTFNNVASNFAGGNGSSGAAIAPALAAVTYFQPTGGGGGGGSNTSNTAIFAAAAGGGFFTITTLNLIAGAAVINALSGTNGSDGYSYLGVGAGGAGGNASNTPGVSGGNGGRGGFPGGGGGGGGGYGSTFSGGSGSGGTGGDGVATVIVY